MKPTKLRLWMAMKRGKRQRLISDDKAFIARIQHMIDPIMETTNPEE